MDESFDYIKRVIPATETMFLVPTAIVSSYTGPGDIVSGAQGWWGLRAYNAAYATGTNPAIDIVDSGGINPATINILATGALDEATLSTWIGAHGTASIAKMYDQTGNGKHLVQSTVANMPTITQNAIGSHSGMTFAGSHEIHLTLGFATAVFPVCLSVVANVTASAGQASIVRDGDIQLGFNNAGDNTWFVFGGLVNSHAANDNAFHAAQWIQNGDATSNFYVDGVDDIADNGAGLPSGAFDYILGAANDSPPSAQQLTGYILESGIWFVSLSANRSSMNSNQHTYWGF